MERIFKPVPNYEELYLVSNFGEVKSLEKIDHSGSFIKGRILKQNVSNEGYLKVNLNNKGKVKRYFVHRLVASAFIENKYNKPEVNHIDENKQNNNVDNLEWVTHIENLNWGTQKERASEKCYKKVISVSKGGLMRPFHSRRETYETLGVDKTGVIKCLNGKQKTCFGYTFLNFTLVTNPLTKAVQLPVEGDND